MGTEEEEGVKWWSRMCMEDAHRYSYVSTYFMSLKAASYPTSFTQGTPRRCSKSTRNLSRLSIIYTFPSNGRDVSPRVAMCNLVRNRDQGGLATYLIVNELEDEIIGELENYKSRR